MPRTRTTRPPTDEPAGHPPVDRGQLDPPLAVYMPLAGFLGLLALSAVLGGVRADIPTAVSLALFVAAVVACSALATFGTTVLLTVFAWCDYEGFVVGRQGSLSWHGRADVVRATCLATAALLVWALRAARRCRSGSARCPA